MTQLQTLTRGTFCPLDSAVLTIGELHAGTAKISYRKKPI
ncbi:MAG: amidohydrolase [bacterium]|nr:amidohydrolase [bacterium]